VPVGRPAALLAELLDCLVEEPLGVLQPLLGDLGVLVVDRALGLAQLVARRVQARVLHAHLVQQPVGPALQREDAIDGLVWVLELVGVVDQAVQEAVRPAHVVQRPDRRLGVVALPRPRGRPGGEGGARRQQRAADRERGQPEA
jgi:hypothetical protein